MENLYFYKSDNTRHNCLKVINLNGDELSLQGDDSCGAFKHLSRTSLAVFPEGKHEMSGVELLSPTPIEFLNALAQHLGYKVVR